MFSLFPFYIFYSQGGRGNDTINGPMTGRGNGASGISRSPLSSVNSLAVQDPSLAEYASIRKFRKVITLICFYQCFKLVSFKIKEVTFPSLKL